MQAPTEAAAPERPGPGWLPWTAGLAVLGVAALVLSWFAWPPTQPGSPTDAVVVLSGPSARLDRGLAVVESGLAPTIVISNGDQPGWARGNALCDDPQAFEVICFRPRPQTTAGEARAIARLAELEGWEHVTLVTSPSHVIRARVLVEQCIATPVAMVTHDVDLEDRLRPTSLARETLGLLAGLTVARAC